MLIRDATWQDVPFILALLAQDRIGSHREEISEPLPEEYRAAFDAIDRDPNNRLVVGEDAGEIVATLQLTFLPHLVFRGGWRAQVEAVRVATHRRGEGLGRQLMEWAIAEARARDCRLVQLTTNQERADAHRFYEGLGFQPTHVGMKLRLTGT